MTFYMDNKQCVQILLAVCHDGGYVPLLKPFAADKKSRDRITLVFGAKIAQSFRNLDWPWTIEFPSVFSSIVGDFQFTKLTIPKEKAIEMISKWDTVWRQEHKERNKRESPKGRSLEEIAADVVS